MANERELFKIIAIPVAGSADKVRRNHLVAQCSKCDRTEKVPTPSNAGAFPPEMAQRIFRRRGWAMKGDRKRDVCPVCFKFPKISKNQTKDTPMKPPAPAATPTLMEERLLQAQSQSAQDKVQKSVTTLKAAAAERPKPTLSVVPSLEKAPEPSSEQRYKEMCAARSRLAAICSMETRWNKPLTESQVEELRRKSTETHEEHMARLEARRQALSEERAGKPAVPFQRKAAKKSSPAPTVKVKNEPVLPIETPKVRELYEAPSTPRSRSAKEARAIRDALDIHYDEERERYKGDMSDRKLAAQLNMPAAWVAELRDLNGYGPDRNESGGEIARELETMRQALKELGEEESRIFTESTKERETIEAFQREQFARMERETRALLDRFDTQTTEKLAKAETRRKEIETRIGALASKLR